MESLFPEFSCSNWHLGGASLTAESTHKMMKELNGAKVLLSQGPNGDFQANQAL